MLEARHIANLKLSRRGVSRYENTTTQGRLLHRQFRALGHATIANIFDIPLTEFRQQLEYAFSKGASYILNRGGQEVGVSAITSLVDTDYIMDKHVAIPTSLVDNSRLDDHIVIGSFIDGEVVEGKLKTDNNIKIAGWTFLNKAGYLQADTPPQQFNTKSDVIMVPVKYLTPVGTLKASAT